MCRHIVLLITQVSVVYNLFFHYCFYTTPPQAPNKMNLTAVENLTLKILETPEKFSSNDFIDIYNTIYNHCTEKSDVFVVRGKDVYACLKSVLITYFESLKPISSLKSFNRLALKFVESLRVLTAAYSYLERYYIKSSINIRDGYTVDTTTLAYTIFYTHFLCTYVDSLTDYILYEIEFQRGSQNPKLESISVGTAHLQTILLYNDLSDVYENLINRYFKNFYMSIRETPITNIVHKTYREIQLSQTFFRFTLRADTQKLTHCISRRYKETLDLYVLEYKSLGQSSSLVQMAGLDELDDRCPESLKDSVLKTKHIKNNLFEYFAQLFYYMKDDQTSQFLKIHNQLVMKDLEEIQIDELVIYYIDTVVLLKGVPITTQVVLHPLKEYIQRILANIDHIDMFVGLVEEIRSDKNIKMNYITKRRHFKDMKKMRILELLMKAVKLSSSYEKIIARITANIQHRLISNNIPSDSQEYSVVQDMILRDDMLIGSIEKIFGVSYISWLKISIDRFLQPLTQSFGISNQEEDLMVEMRMLTKGFWNIKETEIVLHPTLKGIENILIKQNLLKFPRSEINTCYRVSPAVFSLNEFDFRVSTDVLSLLMFISEGISCEEIKKRSRDPNFESNIQLLSDNSIIIDRGGTYSINSNFSQSDYERILKSDETTKRSKISRQVDLFKVEFEVLDSKKSQMMKMSHFESAVEAFIVRTLKKKKRMPLEELVTLVDKKYDCKNLEDIVEKLETKEYITRERVNGRSEVVYLV